MEITGNCYGCGRGDVSRAGGSDDDKNILLVCRFIFLMRDIERGLEEQEL